MTGLHDKRRTTESRRSKLLARSRPDAAPPPARRTMRAEVQVPSRKRVPPARVARSPSERDSEEAPDTPSKRKPYIPARKEKRDELKHDRPCSSRKKLEQYEPWEAPSCARVGLEHYNSMNQGDEHELVKAVGVHPFSLCGGWLHANFLARPKGASNCFDLVPKCFFAELKLDGFGLHCASCVMIDSVESDNLGACGMCPSEIMHPADGVYRGGCQPAAAGSYHGGQTCLESDDDGDLGDLDEAFS